MGGPWDWEQQGADVAILRIGSVGAKRYGPHELGYVTSLKVRVGSVSRLAAPPRLFRAAPQSLGSSRVTLATRFQVFSVKNCLPSAVPFSESAQLKPICCGNCSFVQVARNARHGFDSRRLHQLFPIFSASFFPT